MKFLIPFLMAIIGFMPTSFPEGHNVTFFRNGLFEHDSPKDLLGYTAIKIKRGFILSEAFVDGQKGIFIIDTGAPSLVLNTNKLITNKKKVFASGISNAFSISNTHVTKFNWAGIQKNDLKALAVDLTHLEKVLNLPIAGLIGYGIIKNHELVIDYEQSVAKLFKSKRGTESNAIEIPFFLDEHLPVIEVNIGNQKLKMGLDTGSESNLLDLGLQVQLSSIFSESEKTEEIRGLDQNVKKVTAVQINSTFVNGKSIENMKYLYTPLSEKCAAFDIKIDGLLGAPFFRMGKFSINYKKKNYTSFQIVHLLRKFILLKNVVLFNTELSPSCSRPR